MKPVLSFLLVSLLASVVHSCSPKPSAPSGRVAETPLVEITDDAVLLSLADPHQPLRAGASGLWCVTLPAAWQQGTKLTGKPMVLSAEEQLSGWLNAVPPAADLVPEKSLYASFGELADADTDRVAARRRRYSALQEISSQFPRWGRTITFCTPGWRLRPNSPCPISGMMR